jgi:hypothetical protein
MLNPDLVLEECVIDVIKRLSFPPPSDGLPTWAVLEFLFWTR